MKYTRYSAKPKKKNNSNHLFYLALTLLLALVLGTFVQKILIQEGNGIWFKNQGQKNQGEESEPPNSSGDKGVDSEDGNNEGPSDDGEKNEESGGEVIKKEYNFYLLQCGVFKVKDNANKLIETLKLYGRPFSVEEGELTKVYYGVYTDETIGTAIDLLKGKGIDTSKATVTIPVEDLSLGQMCKIFESIIEIMNKTNESGVKSIKTIDIKEWVGKLAPIEEGMKQYSLVEEMKGYINNLPEEVDKNSIPDGMKLIYEKIKGFK